jgi:hypothetical protein
MGDLTEAALKILAAGIACGVSIVVGVIIIARGLGASTRHRTRTRLTTVAVPAVLGWLILRWLAMLALFLVGRGLAWGERVFFFGLGLAPGHEGSLWFVTGMLLNEVIWAFAVFVIVGLLQRRGRHGEEHGAVACGWRG